MIDNSDDNRSAKFSIYIFGIHVTLELRTFWHWIALASIALVVSFVLFLTLGSETVRAKFDSLRTQLAEWISPDRSAPPRADAPATPRPASVGINDTAPQPMAPSSPPDANLARPNVNVAGKQSPEVTVDEIIGQEPTSLRPDIVALPVRRPPKPERRIYSVRSTNAWTDKPFGYLPLRERPGGDEPKIRDLMPGTTGLIATGNTRDVKETQPSGPGTGRTVTWIEVELEGDIGWVSGPYVEEVRRAGR